jgi:hypothetical protein
VRSRSVLQSLFLILALLAALGACNNSSFFAALGNKAQLIISPAMASVPANGSVTFSASGGIPPYAYSVTSGPGSIDASSGVYTATATAGTAIIQVKDSQGSTAKAVVNPVTYAVTAVSNTGLLFAGGAAGGTFTIQNQGNSNGTQQISWTVYASPSITLGTGSVVVASGTTGSVNGQGSRVINFTGVWPTTPNNYYLIVSISSQDSTGATAASATTYNVVLAQVNYTVTAVNYGAVTTNPGGAVSGTFTYHNGGPDNGIQSVNWEAYASTTNTLTAVPSPVLIASGTAGPLNNGVTSLAIPFNGNWPLVYGSYYLVVKVTVLVDNNTSVNNLGATATSTPVGIYTVGTPHAPYGSPYVLGTPMVAFRPGMSISVTGTLASGDAIDFLEFSTGTAISITFAATWPSSANAALEVDDPTTGLTVPGGGPLSVGPVATSISLGPWSVDLPATPRLINISCPAAPYPGPYTLIITAAP